jgi:fluoroquinolone transport system permease protein
LVGAAFLLPARVALYVQPVSGTWAGAHQRWALLLALALAPFAAASRDPAHRRLLRRVADRGAPARVVS